LVAGVLTGLVGGGYRALLDHVAAWRVEAVSELGETAGGWIALVALCAAGAAGARWLTWRFAPEAAGSGIPAVEDELEHGGAIRWQRVLPVKFFAGALALGSALSLGREGPTVHMGAALATAVGERQDEWKRRVLVAAGAGAGLTAAFTAPLAGFVFILEELRLAPNALDTGAALCAVLASYLAITPFVGAGPMFPLPAGPTPSLELMPLFVVLGIAAGLIGMIFNRGLVAALDLFERLPSVTGAAAVGAVAAVIAWWLPLATGSGDLAAQGLIQGSVTGTVPALMLLLAVKLALTLVSYGCGVPGGIFAPQLALGATLGVAFAAAAPGLASAPALATAGMVGVFAASVRAPATGLVLVVELTHSDQLLVAQVTTATVAYLLAAVLGDRPVYEALRERVAPAANRVVDGPAPIGKNPRPEDTP
jgi:H+/Cl- antiporter ClcA